MTTFKEGDPFPDIALTSLDGEAVRVSDLPGRKAVFFYPKDDTPGCTTEAKDFSALLDEFSKANVSVLGVSKDSPRRHRNFIDKHGLTVPLATDAAEGGLSDALGIWTEKRMYGRSFTGMVRSTFLVGEDDRIERVWTKVKVKDHAKDVLDVVRA